MTVVVRQSCRGCGGPIEAFLALGDQPLANRLRKPGESPDVPRYPLTLCRCVACELVQLREVVDPAVLFADYAYVPSTSSTMRAHFDALAGETVARLGLSAGDLVVDIGSNDGLLLSCFQRRGMQVHGIEPAENLAARASAAGIPTTCAFIDEDVARRVARGGKASLVCATNVFAHVDDIRGFMRAAFELLADDGVFLVEAQSWTDTVATLAFDMTYHEHMTYYATAPLARLCEVEGFVLLDVDRVDTHGGSLRALVGRPGHRLARPDRVGERVAAESPFLGATPSATFATGVRGVRQKLRDLVRDVWRGGGQLAAYGAPAKATVLLNYCGLTAADVRYVVDKNPAKQGNFIPGADIPVVGPEMLLSAPPTHLLLLAWNIAPEIRAEQRGYEAAGGRFIVPVPVPVILA